MSRKSTIVYKLMPDGSIASDANGIAIQILQIQHTHIIDGKEVKQKHPTESPYIDADDVVYADDEKTQVTVTLPAGHDVEKFRKAYNQGLNLLTQQGVHSSLTPIASKELNREKVIGYVFTHMTEPTVVALMEATAKATSKKDINTLRDVFYDEFIAD